MSIIQPPDVPGSLSQIHTIRELSLHLLPVAVAAGELTVAKFARMQQDEGEKTTLFQIVRIEGAYEGVQSLPPVRRRP